MATALFDPSGSLPHPACRAGTADETGALRVCVHYPLERGELRLRTELDWSSELAPIEVDRAAGRFTFEVETQAPFLYFKPVLRRGGEVLWAQGDDGLAVAGEGPPEVFPHFFADAHCTVCSVHQVASSREAKSHAVRVFCPPGHGENSLARFPVVYMQDGQNLFFPNEAFGGQHWRIEETLALLSRMSLTRKLIVVGIYPLDRMSEYTEPGYRAYGRFLAEDLKPWVDRHYQTLPGPESTAVMGSSLGGVVSFHAAWEHPEVFGNAACLSSTFGFRDDLFSRVASEPLRPTRIYLDSGWPRDNYEVTRAMRELLVRRGYDEGHDLFYFAFPEAKHDERAWAMRVHLPFQLLFGLGHPALIPTAH